MIKIGNKTKGDTGEYVSRGTALGNPFSFLTHSRAEVQVTNRAEAVMAQGEYMLELIGCVRATHPAARNLIDTLEPQERERRGAAMKTQLNALYQIAKSQDLTLVCFCAPKPCHAGNIALLLEQALNTRGAP